MPKKIITSILCLTFLVLNSVLHNSLAANFFAEKKLFKQLNQQSNQIEKPILGFEIGDDNLKKETNESAELEDQKFTNHSIKFLINEFQFNHKRSGDQILISKLNPSIILPPPNC